MLSHFNFCFDFKIVYFVYFLHFKLLFIFFKYYALVICLCEALWITLFKCTINKLAVPYKKSVKTIFSFIEDLGAKFLSIYYLLRLED